MKKTGKILLAALTILFMAAAVFVPRVIPDYYAAEMPAPIFAAPDGLKTNTGTREKPMSLQDAIDKAVSGQSVVLLAGAYNFTKQLSIGNKNHGEENNMKKLIADPYSQERPVFDFGKQSFGMRLQGNYWQLKGFDIINTGDNVKGLQISGHYNTVEQVNAYDNGDTGIQISGSSSDTYDKWPSNNLVLNCTSYHNADSGFENADGFAAKLTVGDGNVFRGCIAFENADDGYDLYAKTETGPIGAVTIEDSLAFRNGYVPKEPFLGLSGDGNGFKLGGMSIPGAHILRNSIAYENTSKGIDSNSGPDVKVYNSTSFNNYRYNVALYTNDAAINTNYTAKGVLSIRSKGSGTGVSGENIKLQGQSTLNSVSNYFWTKANGSRNSSNVKADESVFVSIDTSVMPMRNGDGTINMNGLFEPGVTAPKDSGARIINKAEDHSAPAIDSAITPPEGRGESGGSEEPGGNEEPGGSEGPGNDGETGGEEPDGDEKESGDGKESGGRENGNLSCNSGNGIIYPLTAIGALFIIKRRII